MTEYADDALRRLTAAFGPARDSLRAEGMAAYMRNQFPFLGIPTTERRRLAREALSELGKPTEADLVALSAALWRMPEREYQYAAVDFLSRHGAVCGPGFLSHARSLIVTKAWWDTVDALAAHVVGGLVANHPALAAAMDEWVEDDDLWIVRTAILHQLRFKGHTDATRLFRYCERRAGHPDFFIRKAIGWALREYSKTHAAAVREFVAFHENALSGLSKREALLWLNGGRSKRGLPGSD